MTDELNHYKKEI